MDPEIVGDLLEPHARIALAGDPHDVIAELLRIGLRHPDILSGPFSEQATLDVIATRGRPSLAAGRTRLRRYHVLIVDVGASISQTGSMLVRDNVDNHRYELIERDEIAGFIDYHVRDGQYWLVHTELEEEYGGRGAGSFLVRKTLDDLRSRGVAVVPTCPFVGGWIRRHPEYQDLVDKETLREFKRSRHDGRHRTARRPPFDPAGRTVGTPCSHVPGDLHLLPNPWPPEGCAECVAMGRRDWVHLRVCQDCGHVGCCDNSPGKHTTAHAEHADHPLIRSYEPDESWWYCYVDVVTFEVSGAPPAPSHD